MPTQKYFIALVIAINVILLIPGPSVAEGDTFSAHQVITNGFGISNNTEIETMCHFNGNLYAGTRNEDHGSQIWKSADGESWECIQGTTNGFGDPNNIEVLALREWKGSLYAATRNDITGTEIWASTDGTSWGQVNIDGFGTALTTKSRHILGYQDRLFVFSGNHMTGGQVCASSDGTTWTQVNTSGFGDSANTDIAAAALFDGYLYCATEKATGIEIWRYNGAAWENTVSDGFGDPNNVFPASISVFDNYLYVGTENNTTLGETWRSLDGVQWERVGQILGGSEPPLFAPTTVEDNRLYAGGSRARNGDLDTLYYSNDGVHWSPVLIDPGADYFNGISLLNYDGSIYAVSPVNDTMNNVWKLTRMDSSACPSPAGDINGDHKVGMAEAINALQVVAGLRYEQQVSPDVSGYWDLHIPVMASEKVDALYITQNQETLGGSDILNNTLSGTVSGATVEIQFDEGTFTGTVSGSMIEGTVTTDGLGTVAASLQKSTFYFTNFTPGHTFTTMTPQFSWTAHPQAATYFIRVMQDNADGTCGENQSCTTVWEKDGITGTNITFDVDGTAQQLISGERYRVRVYARSSDQTGLPETGGYLDTTMDYTFLLTVTYSWYAGHWGDCIDNGGAGIQYRDVYCGQDPDGTAVDNSFCEIMLKPATSQPCFDF